MIIEAIISFLRNRKYCTELYISPLGSKGGEAWQVELNYGDKCVPYQATTLEAALAAAMSDAIQRKLQSSS